MLARFALAALLLGALFVTRLLCEPEFDAVRILRAEVSLAISLSISWTILAVSTMWATVFTGWIYDHLLPHAATLKVAIR